MPSATSLHIIQSSEAASRLDEAERWLDERAGRGALVVSAARGAADDLVAQDRCYPWRDRRPPPLQLRPARRAPRRTRARSARHRARDDDWGGSRRRKGHLRRAQRRGARLLRRRGRHARLSTRAGAHAPRSRHGWCRRGAPAPAAIRWTGPREAPRGLRRTVRGGLRHQSRLTLHRRVRGHRRRGRPAAPPARRAARLGGGVRPRGAFDRRGARNA